jgi:pimeloyl-ACP methyl ester carboxylesterase
MMSTTGNTAVGQTAPEVLREVFGGPQPVTREETIEHRVKAMLKVGSPGYPSDENELRERCAQAYDRCHDTVALARQSIATVSSGDRTERLRSLQVPTLVIHGLADRMIDVSGGRATAEAIPGAELILIEGMGHGLPPGLRLRLAEHIAEFVWRAEGR